MLNIKDLADKCFIEVNSADSIKIIESALTKYKPDNICCLFFHYDQTKIISDYQLVKEVETKTKMHINYFDVSAQYENMKHLTELCHFYPDIPNGKEIKNQVIITEIINYYKDELTKYKSLLEYKGK